MICNFCNRSFSSKQNLNYHIKNMVCRKKQTINLNMKNVICVLRLNNLIKHQNKNRLFISNKPEKT